jgi:membrane-associated phospholipid phosphatase
MSRDSRLKWILIGLIVCAAGALITIQELHFPPEDAVSPLAIALLLGGAAAWYHWRGETRFVACLNALLHVTLYTACYSVLMYAAATLNQPLIDQDLMRLDEQAGVHLPSIVEWAQSQPQLQRGLQIAYNSLLWQTPLVIVILGFSGDRRSLERFVLQFMLGTGVCLLVFCFFPAEGPFAGYGFAANETQTRYLQHLNELRDGTRTVVTWRGAEGLITFPSFHTTWAMLLAWGTRHNRWACFPAVLLNLSVIAATLTTGWHYGVDVAGGLVLGILVIAVSHAVNRTQRAQESMERHEQRLTVLSDELAARLLPPARDPGRKTAVTKPAETSHV